MTWWNGELSLNDQILRNLEKFSEKKSKYLDDCIQELIKKTKSEILYQSGIGVMNFKMEFVPLEKALKPFVMGAEDRKHTYEITSKDRNYLVENVVNHFSNKEIYPNIECASNSARYNRASHYLSIKISETLEIEISEEDEPPLDSDC